MRLSTISLLFVLVINANSCKEEVLPKPKAMLRLEYQKGQKENFETDFYQFQLNQQADVKLGQNASLTIDYPAMRASIFITYVPVDENLENLFSDAQKLSYEHVVKADNIIEQPFINDKESVYGMYYEIGGNAASQAQFYVTDSTSHFLTGSLYFYAKPNYDSIYPAAIYLQKDIRQIMESLKWK